jgi:PPOX class probable FMN-dependent enzyme
VTVTEPTVSPIDRARTRRVDSLAGLRAIIPEPNAAVACKVRDHLDHHFRGFIDHSPFYMIATSSAEGRCDVSPRGDAPGAVRFLDERTMVLPNRPGNRLADSLTNIIENPRIGVLFIIPGHEDTLRVNGKAWITDDPELLEQLKAEDKLPSLAIVVEVEEAFLHCQKAFRRSTLWKPETWPDKSAVSSMGTVWKDHQKLTDVSAEAIDLDLEEAYKFLW